MDINNTSQSADSIAAVLSHNIELNLDGNARVEPGWKLSARYQKKFYKLKV